jgi:SAM-dependent methyltransferase
VDEERIMNSFKSAAKDFARRGMPLSWRKKTCVLMEERKWFDPDTRVWWTRELLRDFEDGDRDGYHRFLWSHHLGYARPYEVEKRFGTENMVLSRKLFFRNLQDVLSSVGMGTGDVRSVFEVGCSLGYQLRYLETDLFSSAEVLEGNDIDAYAVDQGNAYLKKSRSKVRLFCGDMADLDLLMKGKIYDVVLSTGVLMYLQEKEASRGVKTVLEHCRFAAFSGLAHPDRDNSLLTGSCIRERDGSLIHNIDSMIKAGGGEVLSRRWEGKKLFEGQTIYFVYAKK